MGIPYKDQRAGFCVASLDHRIHKIGDKFRKNFQNFRLLHEVSLCTAKLKEAGKLK